MATEKRDKLARKIYGCKYSDCDPGEKAQVTKKFNKLSETSTPVSRAPSGSVIAEIGRQGQNGVKKCLLSHGATITDLVKQSKLVLSEDKESVSEKSTGNVVSMDSTVKNGEIYVITAEITSNF